LHTTTDEAIAGGTKTGEHKTPMLQAVNPAWKGRGLAGRYPGHRGRRPFPLRFRLSVDI